MFLSGTTLKQVKMFVGGPTSQVPVVGVRTGIEMSHETDKIGNLQAAGSPLPVLVVGDVY